MSRLTRIALLLPLLALLAAVPAWAQGPEPAPVSGTAPAPLNNAGTVLMVSQTVDAALREGADGALYADVRARTKLHNTSKSANARPFFGWPFWSGDDLRFDPSALPGFAVTRDEQPITLTQQIFPATFGGQTRNDTPWLVTEQSIGRDEQVAFDSSWRQALAPPGSPLVTFRYGLLPAGNWAAPIGSARITIQLPGLTSQEQIVSATPISPTFSGTAVEWLLVEEEPGSNMSVTLIAPELWRDLESARATVAAEPATVEARLHLADLYQRLADAGVAVYDGEAEAALLAAREAAPDNPEPHWRLAERYQRRVGPQDSPDLGALELTIDELDAALAAGLSGDREQGARAFVVAGARHLADVWLAQGDSRAALAYLDRAARWAEGSVAEEIAARRRDAVAQTVLDVLDRQGLDAALAFAAEEGLPVHDEARPSLAGLDLQIWTGPEGRRLAATFTGDQLAVAALGADLQARLRRVSGVEVTWQPGPSGGTLDLRWGSGQSAATWAETGAALARALPDTAPLDLLRAALSPDSITYEITTASGLTQRFEYQEQIALTSRAADVAAAVRAQADRATDPWERALLDRYASDWQAFIASQSTTYEVAFAPDQGQPLRRRWQPALPASETLSYRAEVPRLRQWLRLISAGLVGLLAAIALIWRWPVYR
ncbi:MAG: hypothetical protein M5U01_21575 [Ardenticatenaceae bacterium]|nr:hypothetical protein [Ardenticatenaceae bacterium]